MKRKIILLPAELVIFSGFPSNNIDTRTRLANAELAIETKTMQILDFDQPFSIDKLVEIFPILTQLKHAKWARRRCNYKLKFYITRALCLVV